MLVLGQVVIALGLLAASAATSYAAFTLLLVAAGFGYGMLNPSDSNRSGCRAAACWAPRCCRRSPCV
jgi:hypothetical protein